MDRRDRKNDQSFAGTRLTTQTEIGDSLSRLRQAFVDLGIGYLGLIPAKSN